MKRAGVVIVAVLCVFADTSRDAYRNAYRAWRQADPNLEREAGAAGPALAGRISSVATLAAQYGAERKTFLMQLAGQQEQSLAWLENPAAASSDTEPGVRENVASEAALVKRNLDTFAHDPDPAIQQLKGMLDRENAALASLAAAIAERQSAADSTQSAAAAAEGARTKALDQYHALVGALKVESEQGDREAAAWAEYYRKLAEAVRIAPPQTSSAAPAPTAPAPSAPAPRVPITPLPLTRYTGAWTFPAGGLFHGPQPEFLDLVVYEDNGRATGTLFARFKLPSGSKDDPVLRLDLKGDFKGTRTQIFPLETSDGAKGTIELIPGPAFNLLEINFLIDQKPGKIRQGNAVLMKK
jgi:hypothetical protein